MTFKSLHLTALSSLTTQLTMIVRLLLTAAIPGIGMRLALVFYLLITATLYSLSFN